jgi:hypothetical protein
MMMESTPTTAFVMTEVYLLLEFQRVAFNPPAHLGLIDHALERYVGRQRGEPVVVWFGFALRQFD